MNPVPVDLAAQSLRALIVDDDPRWRAIVAEVLSELGWSITALAAPPDDVHGYQLAVLDIRARSGRGAQPHWIGIDPAGDSARHAVRGAVRPGRR